MFQHSLFYENESENEMEGGELSSVTTCGEEYSSDEGDEGDEIENGMKGGDNSEYDTDTEIMLGDVEQNEPSSIDRQKILLKILKNLNFDREIENTKYEPYMNILKKDDNNKTFIKLLLVLYKHHKTANEIIKYENKHIVNIFVNDKVYDITKQINENDNISTNRRIRIGTKILNELKDTVFIENDE